MARYRDYAAAAFAQIRQVSAASTRILERMEEAQEMTFVQAEPAEYDDRGEEDYTLATDEEQSSGNGLLRFAVCRVVPCRAMQ